MLFALGLWTTRLLAEQMTAALLPVAIAGALVGVATVIAIGTGSDFNWYLHSDATLRFPIGYRNANAAFFLTCLWPLIGLAAHNDWRWQLRAPMVAAATLLLELAVIAQSRGSLPAAAIALLAILILSPHRLRTAVLVGLAAIPALPALPALLDVYRHGAANPGVVPLLHDAARAIALSTIGSLLLASLALGLAYPRLRLGPTRVRAISWVAAAVATLVVLAGGAAFVASTAARSASSTSGSRSSARSDTRTCEARGSATGRTSAPTATTSGGSGSTRPWTGRCSGAAPAPSRSTTSSTGAATRAPAIPTA